MKYIISKDRLKRIIRSYIGDVVEDKYDTGDGNFDSWVSPNGMRYFALIGNGKPAIDELLYDKLVDIMSVDNWSGDNYVVFRNTLTEVLNDIMGTQAKGFYVYDLN